MIKKLSLFFNTKLFVQFIIFLGFLYISFVANAFPRDSFVAGGDFYQLIQPSEHLGRYFYAWINQVGQGTFSTMWMVYPFYVLLSFLGGLGFNSSTMAGLYIFLQLYLSYWSFYLSITLLYPRLAKHIQIGGGLVYALNNFTFTIFTYPWGFTHHFLLYIFIPPLLLLFLKILTEEKISAKYFWYFGAVVLLSSAAYNNLVFLVLLFFAQFVLMLVFLLFRQIKINKKFFLKIILIALVYLFFCSWLIISIYHEIPDAGRIYSNKIFGENYLSSWILLTSNSFLNTLMLVLDNNRFPVSEKGIFSFLSMAYFAVVLVLFMVAKRKQELKKIIYPLAAFWIVFAILSVRAYGPFKEIGLFLYQVQPFVLFRSPEKIFLLLPFVYTSLLVGLLYVANIKKKFVYLIFGILLIVPPFYTNKMHTILTQHDVPNSRYSYVIKIPKEYYDAQEVIQQDPKLGSVISLPYSVKNSVNWAQYPAWKFIGHDILHVLYDKFYVSANSFDHPNFETVLSFKDFNEKEGSPDELLALFKKFSGSYVFYHKDVEPEFIENSKHTRGALQELVQNSKIELITSNSYFDLYQVRNDEFIPVMDSNAPVAFGKVNPSKYRVMINLNEKSSLEFHQTFDAQWKLYPVPVTNGSWCRDLTYHDATQVNECSRDQKFFEGEELSYFWKKPIPEENHTLVKEYANSWTIDPEYIKAHYSPDYYNVQQDGSIDVEFVAYFKTQGYMYLGIITYTSGFLSLLGYAVWSTVHTMKRVMGWQRKQKEKLGNIAQKKQEVPVAL